MKLWVSLPLLIGFISAHAWTAPRNNDVVEEALYEDFKKNLQLDTHEKFLMRSGISSFDHKLFLDALEDLLHDGHPRAKKVLRTLQTFHYNLSEKLRVGILRIKYHQANELPADLKAEIELELGTLDPEQRIVYLLAAFEEELLKVGHADLIELAKKHPHYQDVANDEDRKAEVKDQVVTELFHHTPDTTTYMNGEYVRSVKIFKFCRTNRLYPCLMVMKDIFGRPVRREDGSLWTHRSLASSKRGLPSYSRNGDTPAGIFTIDSVMPFADQQLSFGKFRRLILNFVPKSKDEILLRSLMPESSHNESWWRQSVVARDMGRNLFRIHGTGRKNTDPNVPYFPFMRTAGCIAQRENNYDGVEFQDQRILLDSIMKAMDLRPNYENELKIKGILYLAEIDDKDGPVEISDLALRGIE